MQMMIDLVKILKLSLLILDWFSCAFWYCALNRLFDEIKNKTRRRVRSFQRRFLKKGNSHRLKIKRLVYVASAVHHGHGKKPFKIAGDRKEILF